MDLKYRLHYFSTHPNREVTEVYWYSIINNLALSLVFIFEPIYLYTLGFSLIRILWFYVEVYVLYILLISIGAKFASIFGFKHSIFVSNIFYIIYWLVLFAIADNSALIWVAPLFFALQKSWFWPAYDADMAIGSQKKQRGRETGVLFAVIQGAFILGPFLGGFVSEEFGFLTLFVLAAVLMFVSAYPLFRSPDIYSRHEFRFKDLWDVFKNHKRNFFGYWGFAEDLMVMSLWPVYMYIVIPDFFNLGLVSTIATTVGTMIMLYIGRITDKVRKTALIARASIIYGATWILRMVARDLAGVLTFDALTKTSKDVLTVPMMALTFENAASKNPDHAIAYSVFYEFSLSVGKIVTALAAIAILAATGNIFLVFALVGTMTMLYSLLNEQ